MNKRNMLNIIIYEGSVNKTTLYPLQWLKFLITNHIVIIDVEKQKFAYVASGKIQCYNHNVKLLNS